MSIIFKPTGSLDVGTDPSRLPEDSEGLTLISGAMKRCKNLRLDENGVLKTRDGSYKINATALVGTMDYIIEQGGYRYVMGGQYVYRNETLITDGIVCETPAFSPDEGLYAAAQTVTITAGTVGSEIYYTIDGTTPSKQSNKYEQALIIPLLTTLKAIAVRDGFVDSAIKTAYYGPLDADFVTETLGDNLWTETNNDDFVGEGLA